MSLRDLLRQFSASSGFLERQFSPWEVALSAQSAEPLVALLEAVSFQTQDVQWHRQQEQHQ